MHKRTCVQVRRTVRTVAKHPAIRSSVLLRKHVIRGATLGLVPDALNDLAFHHAQLSVDEVIHVLQDQAMLTSISTALFFLSKCVF